MSVKVDSSRATAVVTCSECPGYAEGALDRAAARRLGAAHELRAHPESKTARDAAQTMTRRHAAKEGIR